MANYDISYTIRAVDAFSATATKVSQGLDRLSAKASNLSSKLVAQGKSMQATGRSMMASFTLPLVAAGTYAVKNYNEQAQAISKLETAYKTLGSTTGRTLEQFKKQAKDIQAKTIFGDDQIIEGVTAQMMKFSNISGTYLDRAQMAVVNMTSQMDGLGATTESLKMRTLALGKALNDPAGSLGALTRMGIQFNEQEEKAIKNLTKSGRLREAQEIILRKVEKAYAGQAEALAKNGLGPMIQMEKAIGDMTEEYGKLIVDAIIPFVRALKTVAEVIGSLPAPIKSFIVTAGLILTAIGPVIWVLGSLASGISTLITVVPVISSIIATRMIPAIVGMNAALMTSPITWIVLGIASLIAGIVLLVKNWDNVVAAYKRVIEIFMKSPIGMYIKFQIDMAIGAIKFLLLMLSKAVDLIKSLNIGDKISKAGGFIREKAGSLFRRRDVDDAGSMLAAAPEVNNKINQNIRIVAPKGTRAVVKNSGDNLKVGLNMAGA